MKKRMKKIASALSVLVCAVLGGICGFMIMRYMDAIWKTETIGEMLFSEAYMLVLIYLAVFLQLIIHEGGHLVFGLLTGYRFSSFRIGSFMWAKRDGKLHFFRFSLAGTGGQCLLSPPELEDGKCPYVLYNLGGSLMNLLTAAFAGWLAGFFPRENPLFVFLVMLAALGVLFALLNGVPMRVGGVDNDGYNAFSIGKNPGALRAFWVQMKANQQILEGVRLRDMPEEWFVTPSDEAMKNSMAATLGVFACNRLLDEFRFAEADRKMERLLSMDTGIVGIHRNLLKADMVFCELVGENRKERLDSLLDKSQKKFMKAMKKSPSILRTEYAYALLGEENPAKAEQVRAKFEKETRRYPYANEVKAERELMDYADSVKKAV